MGVVFVVPSIGALLWNRKAHASPDLINSPHHAHPHRGSTTNPELLSPAPSATQLVRQMRAVDEQRSLQYAFTTSFEAGSHTCFARDEIDELVMEINETYN